ncbi:putative transcription repressor RB family [Dioscorea sansibarensis]
MSPGAVDANGGGQSPGPSNSDDAGEMEARFADLCEDGLTLDESTARSAMVLFKETKQVLVANMSSIGSGSAEEAEKFWSAFILYCVSRLRENSKENENGLGVTLCQILRATKLKIADFFKEMPQFSLKAGHVLNGMYGLDWEKRLELKEMQANVAHLCHLSRYYKRTYEELFLPSNESTNQQSAVSGGTGYVSDHHRFGWLLFLALRVHEISLHKDLVTCTNGLVSVLAVLIIHVPVQFRKFSIQDSPLFAKKSNNGVNILASLCDAYHTSEDELRGMMDKVNYLIVDVLKKSPRIASECKAENLDHVDTDGLTYFEDLLEEKSLRSSLVLLEKDYDDVINRKGELDERMFLNEEDSLLGNGSLSGGPNNICNTKRKFEAMTSPSKTITSPLSFSPVSPANGNCINNSKVVYATPVSTAMTTAKWLRNVISALPSKPSQELVHFLSSCDRDLTGDVVHRAKIILEAVFPSKSFGERCIAGSLQSASLMDGIWAEQRKLEAMKLYYRVLEAICRAEAQILNGNNLTSLLSNERFHRCMLACSAELVLATHKTITLMFPAVLERAGITAFDLSKVIESFVRHEETLPRELKRHLNSLEERLLESMAWEKGSSMYNSLIVARPALSAEINRLGLLAEPMPSLDAIAIHLNMPTVCFPPPTKWESFSDQNGEVRSPKRLCSEYRNVLAERNSFTSPVKECLSTFNCLKPKLPHLQSAFASPTRPNPAAGGEMCAETGINIFFSKIVKLVAIRIRSMCERLQLPQEILERVYTLIQHILSQHAALFFNRHIDQLILCSFYGVAKISQLSLTFKEIIYNYRKQPQCKPQIFRSVYVNWPSTSHNGRTGEEHVDIITFYNEVFIPSVKPLLVELGSGVNQSSNRPAEDKDNTSVSGSPRLSPFPSLPDMSPKKVSTTHNVYVSPLRSSKMDALLSPSSKSYYACVGESTHAYQSPSKDLTAINNRLNCGRRVHGRLNFDVVSDSVVAGSLGPQQNGSSASSAAAATSNLPIKSEQADP